MKLSASVILCLIAVVFFCVAAFGGSIANLNLVPLGLGFFAAAHITS